jgi:hypothetical protein
MGATGLFRACGSAIGRDIWLVHQPALCEYWSHPSVWGL